MHNPNGSPKPLRLILNYFLAVAVTVFGASAVFAFLTAFLCFLNEISFAAVPFAATGLTFAKAAVPRTNNANINTLFMISGILN